MIGLAPPDTDAAQRAERQAKARAVLARERLDALAVYARRYGTHWLVGLDKQVIMPGVPGGTRYFNCGLFLDAAGGPLACYDKMYPVMFGEYIPLADRFPWLYRLTPLPAGLTAGRAPVAVKIAGREVAPTICYETALPMAVRSIVRDLAAADRRPDVIVNLTNDGWFWGSSELDMHLTAAIFRAVEVRTPIVIAANTGFSAAIDGSGRLLQIGPRRATATLRARVQPDGRSSPWLAVGSAAGWIAVAVAMAVMCAGVAGRIGPRESGSRRLPNVSPLAAIGVGRDAELGPEGVVHPRHRPEAGVSGDRGERPVAGHQFFPRLVDADHADRGGDRPVEHLAKPGLERAHLDGDRSGDVLLADVAIGVGLDEGDRFGHDRVVDGQAVGRFPSHDPRGRHPDVPRRQGGSLGVRRTGQQFVKKGRRGLADREVADVDARDRRPRTQGKGFFVVPAKDGCVLWNSQAVQSARLNDHAGIGIAGNKHPDRRPPGVHPMLDGAHGHGVLFDRLAEIVMDGIEQALTASLADRVVEGSRSILFPRVETWQDGEPLESAAQEVLGGQLPHGRTVLKHARERRRCR